MIEFRFDIAPVGAPRLSRRDRWDPSPAARRYYAFRDHFTLLANAQGLTELPPAMAFIFAVPMPASWSKREQAQHIGRMHQNKPDIDNMIKAVLDSLTYGKGRDDAHLSTIIFAQKVWADHGAGSIHLYVPDEDAGDPSFTITRSK
jgi:Holliday junction resolvase RusA-like endonuclease